MPRVCVLFVNYGPYHLARARALSERDDLDATFIELAAGTESHPWRQEGLRTDLRIETVSAVEFERAPTIPLIAGVRGLLRRARPDVVVTCGYNLPAMLAAARWARRVGAASVLMHESNLRDRPRSRWKESLKRQLVSRTYDAAFVGGASHRRYIGALGIPDERIFEPYDVVDNAYFELAADRARADGDGHRRELGLPQGPYFLFVGRLAPEKNLQALLRSYERYRRGAGVEAWPLVLAGEGPLLAELRELEAELELEDVHWAGFQQLESLPAFYALAGCLVLPSSSEPWGLVVNEAMASGLPVIVSDRCGCREDLVVEESNGFSFDPGDELRLAELLLRVSSAPESERARMGARSQERISAFSPSEWAAGLARACRSGLERAGRR